MQNTRATFGWSIFCVTRDSRRKRSTTSGTFGPLCVQDFDDGLTLACRRLWVERLRQVDVPEGAATQASLKLKPALTDCLTDARCFAHCNLSHRSTKTTLPKPLATNDLHIRAACDGCMGSGRPAPRFRRVVSNMKPKECTFSRRPGGCWDRSSIFSPRADTKHKMRATRHELVGAFGFSSASLVVPLRPHLPVGSAACTQIRRGLVFSFHAEHRRAQELAVSCRKTWYAPTQRFAVGLTFAYDHNSAATA